MEIERTSLSDVLLFTPKRHGDPRGYFCEVFRDDVFARNAGPVSFVQDNHSRSARKGTLRGLHYQKKPFAQGKLVRVTRGAILDVAVDIRHGSPTFGQHVAVELSEENGRQLWIPPGFLHGLCTLTDDTEVLYKVTAYYSGPHDAGVVWNDPDIGVPWPAMTEGYVLSPKDEAAPRLRDIGAQFHYGCV